MSLVADDKTEYNIFSDFPLKEEQIDGIDFALEKQNCILNLQPGTGKTRCGIAAAYRIMKRNKDTVTFIICPKAANTAFKKELAAANLHYSIITTEEENYDNKCRFFIFNYSAMEKMEKLLIALKDRGFRIIGIFDEVHVLGSKDSNQSKKLRVLRPMFSCTMCMTGTPLLNDIEGLYYVVDFAKPGFLGSWWDFKARWLITQKKTIRFGGRKRQIEEVVGYKDIDLLRAELSKVIITRFRDYNLQFYFKECTMTQDERDQYEVAAKGLLDDTCDEKQFSARLWDLQRIADGSGVHVDKGEIYSKNNLMVNTVRECVQRGEAVLIYVELEDTYSKLKEVLESYKGYIGFSKLYLITGKTPYQDRVKCEKNLKAKDVVICTKAGNKSINLQAANNVVFYDLPFAVGDYIQMCPEANEMVSTDKGNVKAIDLPTTFNVIRNNISYPAYRRGVTLHRCLRVHFADGSFLDVSDNHKFKTSTGDWVEAVDSVGQFLERDCSSLPGVKVFEPETWYSIGFLLGDGTANIATNTTRQGWIKRRNEFVWNVNIREPYQSRLENSLKFAGFKYTISNRKDCKVLNKISVYDKGYRTLLDSVGYDYSKNRIPSALWGATEEEKLSFLDGLYDSDGIKYGNKEAWHMRSSSCLRDVQKLLRTVGVSSWFRDCGSSYTPVKSVEVVSIEDIGERECVEITVDSDTHEYTLSGIVSHNCGRVTRTDTKYDHQNIYILEVKDTIDSYKKILLMSHMDLIKQIFGKSSVMPCYRNIDQDTLNKYKQFYKNRYLWCRC